MQTNTLVKCFFACVSFDLWSFISVTSKESCFELRCIETYLFEITCSWHCSPSKRVSPCGLLKHSTCIVNSYFERTLNPPSKVATSKINYVQPNFGFWCQTCLFFTLLPHNNDRPLVKSCLLTSHLSTFTR